MPKRPLEDWLVGQTRWAQRHPWGCLLLIAASCVAAWFGVARLQTGGIGDIFDNQSPGALRYQAWASEFDNVGEVVVLIDRGADDEFGQRAEEATHALGESLRESSAVENVVWGLDQNTVSPKLLLTLPTETVAKVLEPFGQVKPLLESETPTALLQAGMAEAIATSTATRQGADPQADFAAGAKLFVGLMDFFTQRINTPADKPLDMFAAMSGTLGIDTWQFMRSANGRLLVVRASLREGVDGEPGYHGSLTTLRQHVQAIRDRFEEVPMGITGLEPTRSEAAAAIRTAAQRGMGAALAALWVLTALAWRDVRRPIVVTAVMGITLWLMLGGAGAVVQTINPVAGMTLLASAGVALYGTLVRCSASLRIPENLATQIVAPGMVLAGAVWSTAGLAVTLNPWIATPGLRDAGWVGVVTGLVMVVMMVWGLPAVLQLIVGNKLPNEAAVETKPPRENLAGALGHWSQRSRRGAWIAAGVILIAIGIGAWQAEVSDEMTGYLPSSSEGAQWQRRAVEEGGELGLPAAITADGLNEAASLTEQLRALPEVERISGIARMVPEDLTAKQTKLAALDQQIGEAARQAAAANPQSSSNQPNGDLVLQVTTARFGLSLTASSLDESQRPLAKQMDHAAAEFIAATQELDPETRRVQLAALQNDYARCRRQVGGLIAELLEDRELTLEDLGGARPLFSPWISDTTDQTPGTEKVTLKIYPVTATGDWPTAAELDRFLIAVREIAPEVTGPLERFAYGISILWHDLIHVGSLLVSVTALGLGVGSRSWRIGGAVALIVAASWLAMAAIIGWLGGVVGVVAGVAWVLAVGVLLAWLSQLAWATRRGLSHQPRDSAATEAFGLTLALAFVLAAGLRGAQAPGITAVAVGACVAIAIAGLLGLLLIQPARPARKQNQESPA